MEIWKIYETTYTNPPTPDNSFATKWLPDYLPYRVKVNRN